MSGGVESRRRPDIWSYLNFTSSISSHESPAAPRRRSNSSLPMRSSAGFSTVPTSGHADDPFEKPDRHARHHSNNGPALMGEVRSRMGNSSRARLVKAVALIAFVMLLFFVLAPGDRSQTVHRYIPKVGSSSSKSSTNSKSGSGKFPGGDVASDPSVGTKACKKSYSSDKPLVQYALMIDAGSTGSRIHVYRFNNCGPTPELEDEIFEQTAKKKGGSGLSAYEGDPQGAAKSLDVLLKVAMKHVPEKIKGCTPIAVKATAGLRKLGEEQSDEILAAVRKRLETKYPFPVVGKDEGGVEVMDGEDEAVYAWITANYLLKKIGSVDDTPTAAVLDLGGGSTQIVFEPTFPDAHEGGMPQTLAEGDHRHELSFGGRDFTLYQHSYLGFGLMAARENLHQTVVDAMLSDADTSSGSASKGKKKAGSKQSPLDKPIPNPCLIPNTWNKVNVTLDDDLVTVNMTGPSISADAYEASVNAAQCRGLIEKTLDKSAPCKLKPCTFGGIHQPSFARTFAREDIYLLSYFYDRASALGMPESFSLKELKALAERVCAGKEGGAWKDFESIEGALEELEERPETCLDLSFMITLLHTGYGMPIDREVKIAKKIESNELGWCLGASLPLLSKNSGWECKITKDA